MNEYVFLTDSEASTFLGLNLPEDGRIALRRIKRDHRTYVWVLLNTKEPEPEAERDYGTWLAQTKNGTLVRLAALKKSIAQEGLTETLKPVLDAFESRINALIDTIEEINLS